MAGYALTILTATALLATPAAAQSLIDTAGGRYEMQPVDGGVARLDTVTGDVEFCRVAGDAIVCTDATLGGGSGAGGDGELAARLDDLEARVEELEEGRRALIDSDDADRAVDQMQKLFRGFADIVRELDEDIRGETPSDDADTETDMPGRT